MKFSIQKTLKLVEEGNIVEIEFEPYYERLSKHTDKNDQYFGMGNVTRNKFRIRKNAWKDSKCKYNSQYLETHSNGSSYWIHVGCVRKRCINHLKNIQKLKIINYKISSTW